MKYEITYEYDDNGKYTGEGVAQYCPRSGDLLMPPNATLVEPQMTDVECLWNKIEECWEVVIEEEVGENKGEESECLQQS